MEGRPSPGPFLVTVTFTRREDGGLQARCEKVPNFFLSHRDPKRVLADVAPALAVMLSDMYGMPVKVERAVEVGHETEGLDIPPAHICASGSYVGISKHH